MVIIKPTNKFDIGDGEWAGKVTAIKNAVEENAENDKIRAKENQDRTEKKLKDLDIGFSSLKESF